MLWQELLQFLGGATAISLTISYLGRKAIDSFMLGRIESYKANLEKIATEHSIRFSSLHSKRAEIIAEIYELLSDVENHSRLLATPIREQSEPPREITYQNTATLIYKLHAKYNKTRIYFPQEICDLMDKFIKQSKSPLNFYQIAIQVSKQDPKEQQTELQNDLREKFMAIWEEVETNVPIARKAIEQEFRKILGVT